jgi:hypothetical protein
MTLPDPIPCREELGRYGFVVVPQAVQSHECDVLHSSAIELLKARCTVSRGSGQGRLTYSVVTGDHIRSQSPALFRLYGSMLRWVQSVTGESVSLSAHIRSAININCLDRSGHRYPWHKDAVPYTALLFLTSVSEAEGGALLVQSAVGETVAIQPTRGLLVLLDGARCPHAVAELRCDVSRISVPMVFPASCQARPDGLDEFLYVSSE